MAHRNLGIAQTGPEWDELMALWLEPEPRQTPAYTARLAQMKTEAFDAGASITTQAKAAGSSITAWMQANKTAVYLGAAALFLLAMLRGRR